MKTMTFEIFIEKVRSYNPDAVEMVTKAYKFAEAMHQGQKRQSGEDYIIHPLWVAYILAELHADCDTLCAALLHDVIEDVKIPKEEIAKMFNNTIADLVDGVTKIEKLNFFGYDKSDLYYASTRKLIMGISQDVRIIIIKLADRLHNMRTLEFKKAIKQKEIALETMKIFAPLANYIGAYRIKEELEDLSLMYLDNEEYKKYEDMRMNLESESRPILEEMVYNIRNILNANDIPNEIKIRLKNIYGIYKKISKGATIKDIHDLLMLKIMNETVKECYVSLGLIHSIYHPNNRIKDYICNPKINKYQSLHSTIIAPGGRFVQAQIRTYEMDEVASFGLTTYWHIHKGEARNIMQQDLKKYQFFDSLVEIDEMFGNNKEFVEHVEKELFTDQVHVYTPKGTIILLPKGATSIDFAYKIHTQVGNRMNGVMVNDEMVSKDYILQNDDVVKIITSDNSEGPNEEWLNAAVTSLARKRIKETIRKKASYGV